MKVLTAELLPNGSHFFVIEITPAVTELVPEQIEYDAEGNGATVREALEREVEPAVTEEFTWGSDVDLEDAKREMRLLIDAKYGAGPSQPKALEAMVGQSL
jgi:hypothetical protein